MESAPILVTRRDGLGRIVLNRPAAMNAVTVELAQQLERAVRELAPDVAAILVRGAGGNFSVGGDFKQLQALHAEGPDATRRLFEAFAAARDAIAAAPVPVVAAVEGSALAGGFELVQVCDVVVARDDAQLADNHVNFGMLPGGGGSQLLPRRVGRQRALSHILTGERISGTQAAAWGLAHRAVPAERFEAAVEDVLARLAARDRDTLSRAKALVNEGLELPLADALALEARAVSDHLARADALDRFTDRGARR
jgi:enoyl-CoA hydratase/carnithine racemase